MRKSILDADYVAEPGALQSAVAQICAKLKVASDGPDPEAELAEALTLIANRGGTSRALQLSAQQRDEILRALTVARATVPNFIRDYPRFELLRGLEAAEFQVRLWADTFEERAARPSHAVKDADDRAAILRNDLDSRALRQAIEDRAYLRRAIEIEAMIEPPTGIFA